MPGVPASPKIYELQDSILEFAYIEDYNQNYGYWTITESVNNIVNHSEFKANTCVVDWFSRWLNNWSEVYKSPITECVSVISFLHL